MSALDGLFGVRQILIDGVATTFRQTLNLLGGWTFAPGSYTDVEGKTIETLELTPPSVGGSGSGFPLAADASAAGHKITSLGAPTAGSTNAATALYAETVATAAASAAAATGTAAAAAALASALAASVTKDGTHPLTADWALGDHVLTGVKGLRYTPIADGNTGASKTLDFSAGPLHSCTLNSASVALTFTPPGAGQFFQLLIDQDATGNRKVSSWTVTGRTAVWLSGAAPRLKTSNAGPPDTISGYDDGTNVLLAAAVPQPGPTVGADLTASSVTVTADQGVHRVLPKGTTTGPLTVTLGTGGSPAPKADETHEVVIYAQAHAVVFHDAGAGVDTYTVNANEAYVVHHKWDTVGWRKAGLMRLATP